MYLWCVPASVFLAYKKKKSPLIWIRDKFRKYSGAIFEMPVVGRKINYVLESVLDKTTPQSKRRQRLQWGICWHISRPDSWETGRRFHATPPCPVDCA